MMIGGPAPKEITAPTNTIGLMLTSASMFLFFCPLLQKHIINSSYRRLWVRNICTRPQRHCEMRHFYFEGEKEKLNDRRNRDKKKKVSEVPICR